MALSFLAVTTKIGGTLGLDDTTNPALLASRAGCVLPIVNAVPALVTAGIVEGIAIDTVGQG
jgi:hypothetical protein